MKQYKPKDCTMCLKTYSPSSSVQKVCHECRQSYRTKRKRQWANDNKERDKENRKKWYYDNLETLRNNKRRWNWSEKGQEYRRIWYAKNRDKVNERLKTRIDETNARIKANRIVAKLGWERICSECESPERVQIHHVDGNPFNNDALNLKMICLRCHTLTHHRKRLERDQSATYRGKPV